MNDQRSPSFLESLWRYRGASILIIITVSLLSMVVGILIAPPARARARIALMTPPSTGVLSPGIQGDASLARFTAQRASYMTGDAVITSVAGLLGREDITSLRRQIQAVPSNTSNTITVIAEGKTASEAVAVADAVIRAYRLETRKVVERLTEEAIASIEASQNDVMETLGLSSDPEIARGAASTISQLQLKASDLASSAVLYGDGVEFVVEPRVDAVETVGWPLREAVLGLVLGIFVAGAIAWVRADRDRRVLAPLAAEALLDAPLLGELGPTAELSFEQRFNELDDLPLSDIRLAWTALVYVLRRAPHGVLLVHGFGQKQRTAEIAVSLSMAAARDDISVLLVDADIAESRIALGLSLSPTRGLVEVLADGVDYHEVVSTVKLESGHQVDVLSTGGMVSERMNISTQEIKDQLKAWTKTYDLVVINSARIGENELNTVLAGEADHVFSIVERGTDERSILDLKRRLALNTVPIVGYVFAATHVRGWSDLAGRLGVMLGLGDSSQYTSQDRT